MKKIIAFIIGLALLIGSGTFIYNNYLKPKDTIIEPTDQEDKVDVFRDVREVTELEVTAKLKEISEFSTYSGIYTVEETVEDYTELFEKIQIPGTKNTITINAKGVVKVGYDFSTIKPKIDQTSRTIYIAIPDPYITSNALDWKNIKCVENNCILNPIGFEDIRTLILEIENEGLEEAKNKGLYKKGRENMEVLVKNFLSGFYGYTVEFL